MQLPQDGRMASSAWTRPPSPAGPASPGGRLSFRSLAVTNLRRWCTLCLPGHRRKRVWRFRVPGANAGPRRLQLSSAAATHKTLTAQRMMHQGLLLRSRPEADQTALPTAVLISSKADSRTPGPRDFQTAMLLWEFLAVRLAPW